MLGVRRGREPQTGRPRGAQGGNAELGTDREILGDLEKAEKREMGSRG